MITVTAESEKINKPNFVSKTAAASADEIALHYDLTEGTKAVRGKVEYMPKYPLETDDGWAAKRTGATVYNYYGKTINTMVGLVLRREPKIGGDGDEGFRKVFAEHWENITSTGIGGKMFLQRALKNQFAGFVFIVVDYPARDENIKDKVDEMRAARRPFWSLYKANQALSWRFGTVDNKTVLTQIVFKETHVEPNGAFGEREVIYYRVWYLKEFNLQGKTVTRAAWQLWKESRGEQGEISVNVSDEGVITSLSRLPVAIAGEIASRPPLVDLAYTNIRHYQDYADYRKGKSIAGLALLYSIGLEETDLSIGWDVMLKLKEQGQVGFIEASGAALEAHRTALEDTKTEMSELGMALLIDRSATNVTATEAVIDHAQRSSALLEIADSLKDAVEVAMEIHGAYLGYEKERVCSMDLGYKPEELVLSPTNIDLLFRLYDNGLITGETLLKTFKGGGSLPDEIDVEKEIAKARKERKDLDFPFSTETEETLELEN